MPELIAEGPEETQQWRLALVEGDTVRLGRAPRTGWAVSWDNMISREHADLCWKEGMLRVTCLESARNPVILGGKPQNTFELEIGGEFLIGRTKFRLAPLKSELPAGTEPDELIEESRYSGEELVRYPFRSPAQQLELLARLETILNHAVGDEKVAEQAVTLLLDAIPVADAVAIVRLQLHDDPSSSSRMPFVRWDSRNDLNQRFRPSRRLMLAAVQRKATLLHVWADGGGTDAQYTGVLSIDWAWCTPIPSEACRDWCLYVAGRFGRQVGSTTVQSAEDLLPDVRFACLFAESLGSMRQLRWLERYRRGVSQYFSPAVLQTIAGSSSELKVIPKVRDITVLFCDLRGHAARTEQTRDDDLPQLLVRVSHALSVMTRGIIKFEGNIADFQGDAALGFWGWPEQTSDGPINACRAALAILSEFRAAQQDPEHLLHDFRVGIGLAHGRAIAGKIGTAEQAKVGVFGPTVNLGARLEGMTKLFHTPVLIDEQLATIVHERLTPAEARCRKVARVRPYGLETPVTVYELLLPAAADGSVTDAHVRDTNAAVQAVIDGDWCTARELFFRLPESDPVRRFHQAYMAPKNGRAPEDWCGVIALPSK